ncbi:MAG TPA: uroporphyrinogen decarboxylase family protein [Candidatus Brocadiia bacterium]|nr:uroporphyrinogen decarboxylase family protein [Candidatus Brocadiia bacterium]
MNSVERVKRALRFQRPDHPPLLHGFAGGVIVRQHDWVAEMYRRYPEDFGAGDDAVPPFRDPNAYRLGAEIVDMWGVRKRVALDATQPMVVHNPIEDLGRLKDYRPPEVKPDAFDALRRQIAASSHRRYVFTGVPELFTTMTNLHGEINLYSALAEDPESVRPLADMVFEVCLNCVRNLKGVGADGVWMADDWGTQRALTIRPALWRGFFKPYYRRLVEEAHAGGMDFLFHSCGYIMDIIPDLIEIGVDALHPQIAILPEDRFLPLARRRLCIIGDVDRQQVLPLLPPEGVRAATLSQWRKLYDEQGGLILRGEIGVDVPRANAEAFLQACRDFQRQVA